MPNHLVAVLLRRLVTALAALSLMACAALGEKRTPEAAVKERATQRWQALMRGDFAAAYQYVPPSSRPVVTYERFRGSFGNGLTWSDAEVVSVACKEQQCIATLRVLAKVPRFPGNIAGSVDETWLLEDGKWWMFHKL